MAPSASRFVRFVPFVFCGQHNGCPYEYLLKCTSPCRGGVFPPVSFGSYRLFFGRQVASPTVIVRLYVVPSVVDTLALENLGSFVKGAFDAGKLSLYISFAISSSSIASFQPRVVSVIKNGRACFCRCAFSVFRHKNRTKYIIIKSK